MNTLSNTASRSSERGAAALIVTMALLLVSSLLVLYVNRSLIFEQRSSANQYRAAQAFEASEAGIEWALAMLNNRRRIGSDCLVSSDPDALSFSARYLGSPDASGKFAPTTWTQAGAPAALQPACVRAAGRWSCSCPSGGPPTLPSPSGTEAAPAFTIAFAQSVRPGVVHLTATGCTSLAGACQAGSDTHADATNKVELEIGALPALRTSPFASLTTRGAFEADTASIVLSNLDAQTGLALHSGGYVHASSARFAGPAGGDASALVIGEDTVLAAMSPDRFFASYFGLSKSAWRAQPIVSHIRCDHECNAALVSTITAAPDGASVWVDGDLRLSGPVTLGSAQRPVLLVVEGTASFSGAIKLNGLVYAAALQWNDASTEASIEGAAISEGSFEGNAAPALSYDATLLTVLKARPGAFARVSGSWRDF
jgi:hypothetical protein